MTNIKINKDICMNSRIASQSMHTLLHTHKMQKKECYTDRESCRASDEFKQVYFSFAISKELILEN